MGDIVLGMEDNDGGGVGILSIFFEMGRRGRFRNGGGNYTLYQLWVLNQNKFCRCFVRSRRVRKSQRTFCLD